MRNTFYILTLFLGFLLSSCGTEDYVAVVGQIEGTVVNSDTKEPVAGCEVISSSYGTKLTDANGRFSFNDVEPGKITLTYKATGFESINREVKVTAGSKVTADVTLKPIAEDNSVYADKTILDFGNRQGVLPLILKNTTKSSVNYTVSTEASWITSDPTQGTVLAGGETTINVSVNRDGLSDGNYDKILTIQTASGKIEVQILMTKGSDVRPSVNTLSVSQHPETPTTIKAEGAISIVGSSTINRYGFCYAVGKDPTLEDNDGVTNLGDTNSPINFTGSLPNMEYEKEYHIRAYATNEAGTGYGEALLITLHKKEYADIQTGNATNVTSVSATLTGSTIGGGSASFDKVGFYYGTTPECNLKSSDAVLSGSSFSVSVSGLSPDMDYYYKAYGQDSRGIQYGEVKKFRTEKDASAGGTITMMTSAATNVKETSATLNGAIISEGNIKVKEYGFFYGTSSNPTLRTTVKSFISPTIVSSKNFTSELTKLKESTKYYVVSYAIDEDNKVIRGAEKTFTTLTYPSITLNNVNLTILNRHSNDYLIRVKVTATLHPEGNEVVEAGFLSREYEGAGSLDPELYDYAITRAKFPCEIHGDKITFNEEVDTGKNPYGFWVHSIWNSVKFRGYMVLSDGRIIYSDTSIVNIDELD